MREELLKGLTPEQVEKVQACHNTDEILKVAKNEGVELTEEQLEAVTGGCGEQDGIVVQCKYCGNFASKKVGEQYFHCNHCGKSFEFSEYYN